MTGKSQADAELKKFYQEVLPHDYSGARRMLYLNIDQLARKLNLQFERSGFDLGHRAPQRSAEADDDAEPRG